MTRREKAFFSLETQEKWLALRARAAYYHIRTYQVLLAENLAFILFCSVLLTEIDGAQTMLNPLNLSIHAHCRAET